MNKKIIALILGAALTTGMGGYGTYAYFADHQEVSDNIEIVFGKVRAEAKWSTDEYSNWTLDSQSTEAVINGSKITNVKPGDKFFREIKVTNAGTLKADLEINLNESFNEIFDAKMQVYKGDNATSMQYFDKYTEKAVEPGTEYTVRVELTAKSDIGNDWQGNSVMKEAHDFINVNLTQTVD